jgi:hypothetical protein
MRRSWPWQWSVAGLLALLVFGMHASMRFWLPAVLQALCGEVPDLTDEVPPAVLLVLIGYLGLSVIGGLLIGGCISEGQWACDQARWAHEEETRRRLWAMEQQIREEQLPEEQRRRQQTYRAWEAAITVESPPAAGLVRGRRTGPAPGLTPRGRPGRRTRCGGRRPGTR